MTEIAEPGHWLFHLAMFFLLVSFIQWKEFYLRFTILGCNASLILLGVFVFPISLDVIIWNVIQAAANVFHLVRILLEQRKLKFPPEYEALYSAVFQDVLTRYQFKVFRDRCLVVSSITASGTDIVRAGNPFTEIIILGEIDPQHHQIQLLGHDGEVHQDYMKAWSWIGCIEYVSLYVNEIREQLSDNENSVNYGITVSAKRLGSKLYLYRIKKNKLLKLFNDKALGSTFVKAIMSKMLEYTSHIILEEQKKSWDIEGHCLRTQQDTLAREQPSPSWNNKEPVDLDDEPLKEKGESKKKTQKGDGESPSSVNYKQGGPTADLEMARLEENKSDS